MRAWRALVKASKYQIYVSHSLDPFLNLSIEHFLLQETPPHSTVLFLYVNRPCVVIGRNQNPWLETNLSLLQQNHVSLVRRRSGGGTVFHDEGNVNYSVICPTADFARHKHAKMVTRAIRESNLRARVNERVDIVLDQGSMLEEKVWPDPTDMYQTRFHRGNGNSPPLKISGSAYKITRQRALHHGTCLLASANLRGISDYFKSPARPFIKARGVESVRSPIGNVHHEPKVSSISYNNEFQSQIINAFAQLYGISERANPIALYEKPDGELLHDSADEWAAGWVGPELKRITGIQAGIEELKVSQAQGKWDFTSLKYHPVVEMALWTNTAIHTIEPSYRRRRKRTTAFARRLSRIRMYINPTSADCILHETMEESTDDFANRLMCISRSDLAPLPPPRFPYPLTRISPRQRPRDSIKF